MNALVQTVKQTPVSIEFLRKRMPDGVKVVDYRRLPQSRAKLFSTGKPVVVLIPKKGENVGHFVCLLPWKRSIEYFSSLGNAPLTELNLLGEAKTKMMNILGNNYTYNRTTLQSGSYKVQDCASWCIARVMFSELKLREFLKLFQRNVVLRSKDDVVSFLTLLHMKNKIST